MSLRSGVGHTRLKGDGLPVKLAIPVVALLLVPIWLQILGSAVNELDRLVLDLTNTLRGWAWLYWSAVYLLLLTAFVALYVRIRSVDVLVDWPNRQSVPTLAFSVVAPPALVALTAVVASVHDVSYMLVSDTAFPWFATATVLYVGTATWLLVSVVTAVALLQVVVQSELRAHVDPIVPLLATTAIGGTLFATQGLSFNVVMGGRGYPMWGEYLAILALVAAITLAVAGVSRAERDWQRYAAVLPLGVVAVGTVVQFLGIVDNGAFVGSPIEWGLPGVVTVLFAITVVVMAGLAAYSYERTETILAPTLVYATTYIASAAAVLLVDVGSVV